MVSFQILPLTATKAALAIMLVVTPLALFATENLSARQLKISEAATATRKQCYTEMYRDSNAYAQCIRNARDAHANAVLAKLGAEYFGYVGALSYMRVGHQNAENIAAEFLQAYRITQKKVGISDAELCRTIPGDCTVRLAQTAELLTSPPKQVAMRVQCIARACTMVPIQ
jgi:hypothetical protein